MKITIYYFWQPTEKPVKIKNSKILFFSFDYFFLAAKNNNILTNKSKNKYEPITVDKMVWQIHRATTH
jgi:hypothetical protein